VPATLVAILLGFAAVLQVTINRHVALRWGLAGAVLLNALVLTAVAAIFWATALPRASGGGLAIRTVADLGALRWWWLLPGLLGFALVTLLPWAAHHAGVQRVFVALVAAQVVGSLAWDAAFARIPVTPARAAGALLAIASVLLTARR
jgi:uncharacterized membrane protein YdcZ (DUF606 family)